MDINRKIIGISGNARSGKDTLGKNIQKILSELGVRSKIYSFADELKKSVDQFLIDQLNISAFTEDEEEKKKIRPFLVFWGTDVMRKINDNIWVDKLEDKLYTNEVSIITDVRFENELEWIKKNNGFSLFIKRNAALPANDYEKTNNERLENMSDVKFHISDFESGDHDKFLEITANEILNSFIDIETLDLWKATCNL
jgi:hypothetical protein